MVYMLEKTFFNDKLDIELTSFIDNKQNMWFKGKMLPKSSDILTHVMSLESIFQKNTR